MICKWCNQQNSENNKFCMRCGKELTNTDNFNNNQQQNNNLENNTFNNNYNSNMYNNNINQNNNQTNIQNQVTEEKANVWLAILSWFIPLAGLIIFIVKKDKQPKTAKVSGICALISFILSPIIIILSFSFLGMILSNNWNNISNNINDLWDEEYNYDYNSNYDNDDLTNNNDNNNIYDSTSQGETTNDWKKYQVTVNDKTITLPATYSDIKTATNASMKSSDEKSYLASNYYTLANMYKNDKLALYINLTNDSDSDLLYTECQVTRVSQSKYQIDNGANVVTFPGGLTVGKKITKSEIIELFGNPYDTYEYSSDGYESITYKYAENTTWTTTNHYEIKVVNGIIDQLELDHRN